MKEKRLNLLFVNPPIYDFTAYDFWLKPYGLLKLVGAFSKHNIYYFNFLGEKYKKNLKKDGRGKFLKKKVEKPKALLDIPKPYYRYGASKEEFEQFLEGINPLFAVFLTSSMTYWYLGVKEVIESVRKIHPKTKIVVGGIYPTLLLEHAKKLDADLVVKGSDLKSVEEFLQIEIGEKIPKWSYERNSRFAVLTISRGCPFYCSYCAIKEIEKGFSFKDPNVLKKEVESIQKSKIENIAFYDDALLYRFEEGLNLFLKNLKETRFCFYTPNGMNVRFLSKYVAKRLKEANFQNIFLSLESVDDKFLKESGNKLYKDEFLNCVENLVSSGFNREQISSYILLGHPKIDEEKVKESIIFLKKEGIKPHLSEFSPILGTLDAEACAKYADLKEPLNHNKVAFSIRVLGIEKYQELKSFGKNLTF